MKPWHYIVIGLAAVVLIFVLWAVFGSRQTVAPTVNNANTATANANSGTAGNVNYDGLTDISYFTTADLPDRDPAYNFSATLPVNWVVECPPDSQAVNFYDPQDTAADSLEKSVVFVSFYRAADFSLPDDQSVTDRQTTTVAGWPALTYRVASVVPTDTTNQPSWMGRQHLTLEIRTGDQAPAVFYVFSARPELDPAIWSGFIDSLKVTSPE